MALNAILQGTQRGMKRSKIFVTSDSIDYILIVIYFVETVNVRVVVLVKGKLLCKEKREKLGGCVTD